jgi:hypothetical protein
MYQVNNLTAFRDKFSKDKQLLQGLRHQRAACLLWLIWSSEVPWNIRHTNRYK